MTPSPLRYVLTVGGLAFLIAGCGVHLYRADNHTQAQKAEEAFKSAQLAESLGDERKRTAEIQERQIAAVQRQSQAHRDRRLAAIIGDTNAQYSWSLITRDVTGRLNKLFGADFADMQKLLQKQNTIKSASEGMSIAASNYRLSRRGDPDLVCVADDKGNPTLAMVAPPEAGKEDFNQYVSHCKELLSAQEKSRKLGSDGSVWKTVNEQLDATKNIDASARKETEKAEAAYKAAQKSYADAQAAGQTSETDKLLKAVKDKLDALGKITGKPSDADLKNAQAAIGTAGIDGLQLIGLIRQLEEQRKQILTLVEKIQQARGQTELKAETTQERIALTIAATLPSLDALIVQNRYPPLSVLLLRAEHLRLRLEAAKRRQAQGQRALMLLEAKRDAVTREITDLYRARNALQYLISKCDAPVKPDATVIVPAGKKAAPLMAMLTDPKILTDSEKLGQCKAQVVQLLRSYVSAWTLGRTPADVATFAIYGVDHDAILDETEIAFAQWNNLIGVPLNQLVAYHGSGIRSEDLANFIHAIGLGAIAVGVNR